MFMNATDFETIRYGGAVWNPTTGAIYPADGTDPVLLSEAQTEIFRHLRDGYAGNFRHEWDELEPYYRNTYQRVWAPMDDQGRECSVGTVFVRPDVEAGWTPNGVVIHVEDGMEGDTDLTLTLLPDAARQVARMILHRLSQPGRLPAGYASGLIAESADE